MGDKGDSVCLFCLFQKECEVAGLVFMGLNESTEVSLMDHTQV